MQQIVLCLAAISIPSTAVFRNPSSITLSEQLTIPQQVKNIFPEFYETQKFITAFTRACYLSLS
jgi:hypothetical protein